MAKELDTKKLEKAIVEKDYRTLYDMFERYYSYAPIQMGRYEAFGKALQDGYITKELYNEARDYYGNLWHYVGD